MNVQFPHKWWSTLESAVFSSSSSLPLLVSEGSSGLVCESVGKADLLSDHFDNKQLGRLLICCSLAIHLLVFSPLPSGRERSGLRRLLLDLGLYGGTNPLGMFILLIKRTADVMVPSSLCSVSAACLSG